MGLDDFLESEVAIAAGVTAAALSPGVRRVVRRGTAGRESSAPARRKRTSTAGA